MTKVRMKILLITIMLTVCMGGATFANVQSRPGATSLTGKTASVFFQLIRSMEAPGEVMGLNATIDTAGVETSASNNIDVHMAKNTEWGTAAMLAASAYGSCPSGVVTGTGDNSTSTGNKYGIYQMADSMTEAVAGIYGTGGGNTGNINTAKKRYKNTYGTAYIPGDATTETKNWKGATAGGFVSSSSPFFLRSSTGVFGYTNSNGATSNYSSRAAVVCGSRYLGGTNEEK